MTCTYIHYGNDTEDQYRSLLYDMIDRYHQYDSIAVNISLADLKQLCVEHNLHIDLSAFREQTPIRMAYDLQGWEPSCKSHTFDADRSDAVVIYMPVHNCYGYVGPQRAIIDELPAKVLYDYINEHYIYSGGMMRKIA